ncbi:MAG: HAMP domain-containing histidine kinase [Candidatus Aminicenantes bacterium]|nr:HAMP domain-containing histidine kinase [Candidatus Aminicenantes bacterium]
MKIIEFNPESQSTAFSKDQTGLNDIFREILPVIFHKLKNKLTPIIGYTEILKSRTRDEFFIERLGKIENNANELTSMLNILKDYLKIEAKPKRAGNLNHIVQKLKPDWQRTASENEIDFLFNLDRNVPNMPLRHGQIELLLLNLAANALTSLQMKKLPPREIQLNTRLEDHQVKLIIRDSGMGMEQNELNNIWAPFYAKFQNGTGLGLLICEKIIANHAASCQVRSHLGVFTEFEIVFPLPEKSKKRKLKSQRMNQTIKKTKEDS